ncbi:MAG: hypothetical protein GAK28_00647 [Luteibacter sp.]|uniref:hypothetical protein n=1 Tax=Luteibacter sp. TaxID=1886636 RepID=UPI001383BE0C|nr:hypothetical protein [Luteibacter sp.]KAF1009014.1 MAG: hypothetical protein GAK28_00647 [Luteibacter sp.]
MSGAEQRTNRALRLLDGDLRSGRTTLDDYRRHRRHLLARLRASLDATLDITLRRPAPTAPFVIDRPPSPERPALRNIAAWTLLLVTLAVSAWAVLSLVVSD